MGEMTREELSAMTEELLAYEREHHGDPYMSLLKSKGMQRVALQLLACWGGPEMADSEAQEEAPIARTLPSHTRSDSTPSVSSMSVVGSRRCL